MPRDNDGVNPAMIMLARESRGFTQTALAEHLGVSVGKVSRIEAGLRGVSDDDIRQLCDVLDYPEDFFRQADSIYGFGVNELFHRKRRNVSDRILDTIHARINIHRLQIKAMLEGVEIGEHKFPSLDLDTFHGKVADVARAARAHWYLPHGPIANVTKVIENAGGIVVPFDFGTDSIDAISWWPPGVPPLFFVNRHGVGDRLRYTLCHELGHMLMHLDSPNPEMEKQADQFAAEFLMPEKEIRPYLDGLSLPKLATLKPYWKVSMAAVLKHATDIRAITPRHARTLWMNLSKAGYRTREPREIDIPLETPTLYPDMIDIYRNQFAYSVSEFGKLLRLKDHEVRTQYFGSGPQLKIVS